ncbi:MAB_1171c family putative transporter [Actinophytocola sp.]|uniref:MAB_1171c family putative transporter n=1 Tax=Actinophytocola sp. TaxID=1872138 RepID=UPI00389A5453
MDDLGNYLVASGAVIAGLVRYRTARPRPLTAAQRYVLVVLFGAGAGLVFAATAVQAVIGAVTAVPYLARFLASASVMVSAFSAVCMVASVVPEPAQARVRKGTRWMAAVMVVLILVMAVLLLGSDAAFNPDLAKVLATEDDVAAGQGVYWGFVAVCITWFVVLLRRYLLRPDVRPLMHYAMATATLASVVALLWLGWNVIILVGQRVGGQFRSDSLDMAHWLGIGAAGLMGVSLTLPLWIRALRRRVTRWRSRRAVRGLEPLWSELTDLLPDIALHPPDLDCAPEVVLYRQVIEIRDAELRLMRYVPPDLETVVRDAHARQVHRRNALHARRAPVETRIAAAAFATAMANFRAGRRQADAPAGSREPSTGLSDVLAEARWLIAVHRCMVDDPVVAQVVHSVQPYGKTHGEGASPGT